MEQHNGLHSNSAFLGILQPNWDCLIKGEAPGSAFTWHGMHDSSLQEVISMISPSSFKLNTSKRNNSSPERIDGFNKGITEEEVEKGRSPNGSWASVWSICWKPSLNSVIESQVLLFKSRLTNLRQKPKKPKPHQFWCVKLFALWLLNCRGNIHES